ncbi:MAG: hypothetical protein OEV15_07215, partial [Gallionella sp.]|nr:hypothetical protein [Gallionella sp.]
MSSSKAVFFGLALLLGTSSLAPAAVVSNVANTTHNLSVSGPGTVKATSETQICVFCHTPHAATTGIVAPLWNRTLSSPTYTPYTSSSMEANAAELAAAPGGSSKLCLSCHDGAMTIGQVNVLNGTAPASIAMGGTDAGKMPAGSGAATGFTRNVGVNLSNDHPISFTYDDTLATADGELRQQSTNPDVKNRVAGVKPKFPLENGQMQCATCHDPHLYDQNEATNGNLKFLRGNRIQQAAPAGGAYSATNDIMCLACHDKAGQVWANSA